MPRHKPFERTIYNGNIFGERFGKIKPASGKTGISRSQEVEPLTQSDGKDDNSPFKQARIKRDESILKFSKMTGNQSKVLFKTSTIFPFDLFPDKIIISSTKIEIKICSFFYSYNTVTIPLQDIGFVELDMALVFATLTIINIRSDRPVILNYLWYKDALKARRIINGLLIAQEAGVDVSVIEPHSLLSQIEGLGA